MHRVHRFWKLGVSYHPRRRVVPSLMNLMLLLPLRYDSNVSAFLREDSVTTLNKVQKTIGTHSHKEKRHRRHLELNSTTSLPSQPSQILVLGTTPKPSSGSTSELTGSKMPSPIPSVPLTPVPSTSQPTFSAEKYMMKMKTSGYYSWKITGKCCESIQGTAEFKDSILTEIKRQATSYAKIESSSRSGSSRVTVKVEMKDKNLEKTENPMSITFPFNITFTSMYKLINVNQVYNYANGFQQWFNNSTRQTESMTYLNDGSEADTFMRLDDSFQSTHFPIATSLAPSMNATNLAPSMKTIESAGNGNGISNPSIVLIIVIMTTVFMIK